MGEEDQEVCQSCDYPATDIETYTVGVRIHKPGRGGLQNEKMQLCRVCACTHLSDGLRGFPIEPSREFRASIAWCFNALLDEVRGLRGEIDRMNAQT